MDMKDTQNKTSARIPQISFFQKHGSVWIAVFAALFLTLGYWKYGFYCWETNDDAFMSGIIYGYHGTCDSHLIYINILYGRFLVLLQTLLPSVPWYLMLECAILIASVAAMIYLILERWSGLSAILPVSLFVAYFLGYYAGLLQYTKVAGFAAASGILLLFHAEEQKKKWPQYMAGFVLAWLGFALRKLAFLMVLIPLAGVGVYDLHAYVQKKEFGKLKMLIALFLVLFAGCAVMEIFDRDAYQSDPQWKNYVTYNNYRTQLLDYGFPDYEENRELYESLHISQEDLELFKHWDFDDPEIFNVDAMKLLVEARGKNELSLTQLLKYLKAAFDGFRSYSWFPLAVAAILLPAFMMDRRCFALAVYEIAALFAVEVLMLYRGRGLIARVDAPLLLTVFYVNILYCCNQEKLDGMINRKGIVLMSILILLEQISIEDIRQETIEESYISSAHLHAAYSVLSTDKDSIYFTRSMDLPDDLYIDKAGDQGYLSNVCYLGGWMNQSPVTNAKKTAYGVTNPYRDLVDAEHVRLMSLEVTPVVSYIRRHYAPEAEAVAVRMAYGEFPVYRVVTGPPDLSEKKILPCEDGQWRLEVTEDGTLSGYLYRRDTNSFAADIYLGLQPEEGEERLYYSLQTILPDNQGLMNGRYSQFSVNVGELEAGRYHAFLYLVTGDICYRVDAGVLTLNG